NISQDEVIRNIGYSHYLSAFDLLLPPLFAAFDQLSENDSLHELSEVISLLKSWDKNSSASSVATTVAIEWAYKMETKALPADHPYKRTDAVSAVQSMIDNTTPKQKLELLQQTLQELRKRFGSWKIGWGDVNRYQRPANGKFDDAKWSLPVGIAAATWGSLPSFATRRFQTDKRYGMSGNSFIACVEFGKKVKAKSVITGGQSFDPDSKHYTDQASMYINGNFKDVLFYKEDVIKHAERTYHPGE
ncbi:MAG: penicillin acylase family protein, partial [Flavisolibacter sp.]